MSDKFSVLVAASAAALSILVAYPAAAHDRPSSVTESGPNRASHHDASPTQQGTNARGAGSATAGSGSYARAYDSYEVQTPSSVNESAPFAAGNQTVPTMRAR